MSGLGVAYAALRILVANGRDALPRLREIGIDPPVLAFAFGASVLSGVLFGVIPVLKYAGPRVATALRGVGRTFSGRYYVERVLHAITSDGSYVQRFTLRRNATGLTGQENFRSDDALAS